MPTGIVKWFNSAKGYGFICPEDGGQDVFAHFSAIIMDGYKCLKAGQPVVYEINEGPKGLHASNIQSPSAMMEVEVVDVEKTVPQFVDEHHALDITA